MKLYSVRVRLSGSLLNEVWVYNATASELMVLNHIHDRGENAPLAEVIQTGSVQKRTDQMERARLHGKYHDFNMGQGDKMMREVLGTGALPQEYEAPIALSDPGEFDGDGETISGIDDEVIETLEKPVDVVKPVRTVVHRNLNKRD